MDLTTEQLRQIIQEELEGVIAEDCWDGYVEHIQSGQQIEKPSKDILCYHEFNPVGEENAE